MWSHTWPTDQVISHNLDRTGQPHYILCHNSLNITGIHINLNKYVTSLRRKIEVTHTGQHILSTHYKTGQLLTGNNTNIRSCTDYVSHNTPGPNVQLLIFPLKYNQSSPWAERYKLAKKKLSSTPSFNSSVLTVDFTQKDACVLYAWFF